jgi:hypothetical protein
VKQLRIALLLLVAACQPESRRLLIVDLTLADPLVLETTAAPWHAAGYRVEYRQFYPHLTRDDLARYRAVMVLGGREPQGPSDALTIGDLAMLSEWTSGSGRSGVIILGYGEDGKLDRWVMNRWLAAQGAGIAIGSERVDAPASPLPHSALDNAGFAPFPAGTSDALVVRDRSQMLARSPGGALVAASRVGDGLIVVASRSLLAAGTADSRSRDFVEALARWTRRPAEWAGVHAAAHPTALRLAAAPMTVSVHPPPLTPPAGVAPVALPPPPTTTSADDSMAVPRWIARQGMRVLWSRFTLWALDSLLGFVDAAALNALATTIPVRALADTLGGGPRNFWRVTAERMQATSVRWFPAVALVAIPSQGANDVNRHGGVMPIACGLDSLFWRETFRPVYRALAHLGGARPEVISGVALDLDSATTLYRGSGFCDADYLVGLRGLALDSADTERLAAVPPAARYDTLLERGWLSRYYAALEGAVAERAAALRADLRRSRPDLRFAFRSTEVPTDWFSLGLLAGFSSQDAPALLWLRDRGTRGRALRRHYRDLEIYVLSAVGLEPDRATFTPGEQARLRSAVFREHAGFWLTGAATDSLGRVIRRFAR